ncbi:hypothetical protein DRQ33_03050 [bacterium]|nr:MAG: hypothetical protein DRQ33_03050 [bacterium]
MLIHNCKISIVLIWWVLCTCAIYGLGGGIEAEKISPTDSLIYSCENLPVEFKLWFIHTDPKILWINTPINNTGDYGYSILRDTLAGRGFQNDAENLGSITITDSLCNEYDIIVFGYNIPRDLTVSEQNAVVNFVSAGGGLFVITEYSSGTGRYSDITDDFGITYTGGIDLAFTLSLDTHPITDGVSYIKGNGIMKIGVSSPADCIGDFSYLFSTYCGLAVSEFGSGRVCAIFDELLFVNNYPYPLILEGITDSEHTQFARNLFDWLARTELTYLDTASIRVSVNGTTIDIHDPRLTYADSILTFTPSPDWAEIETVTVCLDSAADGLGNTLDTVLCTYFIVDKSTPIINNMVPWEGSEISDSLFPISAEITENFCDTIFISITVNGQYFTPDSAGCSYDGHWLLLDPVEFGGSWDSGDITACIHAEDICPDSCGSNIADTCWTFTVDFCSPALVWMECPTTNSFVSCDTAKIIFGIHDTTGIEIDTTRIYGTIFNFHSETEIDTIPVSVSEALLFFSGSGDSIISTLYQPVADGDSVIFQLDSVFNEVDCLIYP